MTELSFDPECDYRDIARKQVERIRQLEALIARINEKAVQLRDEIGVGHAVFELRSRVHNIVELTRECTTER